MGYVWENLEITDGTALGTISLMSGPYALVSYDPKVSKLRDGPLGEDPYEDVQDTITFDVSHSSQIGVTNALTAVYRLFEQADRWLGGAQVRQIKVRGRLAANTIGTGPLIEWVVKGWSGPPITRTEPPVTPAGSYVAKDVSIQFLRRGRGFTPVIDTSLGQSVPPSSNNAVTIINLLDALENSLAPLRVDGVGLPATVLSTVTQRLYLAVSPFINLTNAETGTAGGGSAPDIAQWSTAADGANFAVGGSVARYTPTAVNRPAWLTFNINTPNPGGNAGSPATTDPAIGGTFVPVLAVRQNASAASVYNIEVSLRDQNDRAADTVSLRTSSPVSPTILLLPPLSIQYATNRVRLAVTCLTSTSVADNIDFDWIALVQVDDTTGTIIAMDVNTFGGSTTVSVQPASYSQFPTGGVSTGQSNGTFPVNNAFSGALAAMNMVGTSLSFCWFATSGSSWRLTSGGALASFSTTVYRRRPYLIA